MPDCPLHVLLIDDDYALRDLLRTFLQRLGIDVSVLHDATALDRRLERERPDVIVLDVMMPGIDGLTALKELRANGDRIPVIMLTARADGPDRVVGLELGADDYLGKPFLPQELLARIRAVLRRQTPAPPTEATTPVRFGPFILDFNSRALQRAGQIIRLTSREYALLEVFAQHPMVALSRTQLLDLLHGPDSEWTERSIDVPIWRLRRLLEESPGHPRYIRTMRGIGYMFVPGDTHEDIH
ncbi:response regulator [Burkholderia ubonensis]|uniref:response regulator n=1 Tax=Burkholderia ubonensis TaxID=101571 RepID=UPI000BA51867|nr:response regulator [Burkholderia ubonensis]PAJ86077.1 two-component system response regulator OmpR [Burkholderia ubonensis]PAJ93042.1 two-component system response regulator OmpR [Burkholderia ubonensis]PAK05592.1 two-component system response regulator OmpR [Burkholderia ubonensis]PAK11623.1 two-component system response regulator OmpR [Burkholderia ubonensis]RQP68225.1 response regulator [Burkholderia ubonensis]